MKDNRILRGYEQYNYLVESIHELFNRNNNMGEYKLDITKYANELKEIESDFIKEDKLLKSKNYETETIALEYESLSLTKINNRLLRLSNNIVNYISSIRYIYILINNIENIIELNDKDQFYFLIINGKKLIDSIDSLNTHNNEQIKALIYKSCEVLYKAIKFESSYDNDKLFKYISNKELSISKKIVFQHLNKDISNKINKPIITDIAPIEETVNKREELQKELEKTIEERESIYKNLDNQRREADSIEKNLDYLNNYYDKKEKIQCNLINTMTLAIFLSGPIISQIVYECSKDKILEYPTCITTDYETGEIISKEQTAYIPDQYNKVIKVYSPWEYSKVDNKYIRKEQRFKVNYDNNDFDISEIESDEKLYSKENCIEYKDKLDKDDSTTNSTILIDDYIIEIDKYRLDDKDYESFAFVIILFAILGGGWAECFDEGINYLKNKKKILISKNQLRKAKNNIKKIEKEFEAIISKERELQASILKEEMFNIEEVDLSDILTRKEKNVTMTLAK